MDPDEREDQAGHEPCEPQPAKLADTVDETLLGSFPASDPPPWWAGPPEDPPPA